MITRTATWLAWSLAGLCVAMFLASVTLYVLAHAPQEAHSIGGADLRFVVFNVPFLTFPLVGTLVVSMRPKNPMAGSA